MVSTGESGFSTLRRIHTRFNSSFLGQQQLFLSRPALVHVDDGENALVHQLALQVDFQVAGSLELFEDDVVHAAAGIDERGGDNGERTTLLDVAGRAEEALGALQSVGVHAA